MQKNEIESQFSLLILSIIEKEGSMVSGKSPVTSFFCDPSARRKNNINKIISMLLLKVI